MTIKNIKIEIQDFLASLSETCINQMSQVQNVPGFDYDTGNSIDNVAAIKYEYNASSFNVVAYPLNKKYEVVGDIIILLRDSESDEFFPEENEHILLG